jgi:hypothetical protein
LKSGPSPEVPLPHASTRPQTREPSPRRRAPTRPHRTRARHGPPVRRRRRRRTRGRRRRGPRWHLCRHAAVTHDPEPAYLNPSFLPSARHSELPPPLPPPSGARAPDRARRRSATQLASLDPKAPPQFACCPHRCLPRRFPRAAAATAAGRRRSPSPAVPPHQLRPPVAPR